MNAERIQAPRPPSRRIQTGVTFVDIASNNYDRGNNTNYTQVPSNTRFNVHDNAATQNINEYFPTIFKDTIEALKTELHQSLSNILYSINKQLEVHSKLINQLMEMNGVVYE